MSTILGIDPGTTESAYVVYDQAARRVISHGHVTNDDLFEVLYYAKADVMAIEMVASYGMAVGAEIFETVYWIGRVCEFWRFARIRDFHRIYRRDVKLHLCGSPRAKDPNIRQAIIDRFGGKAAAFGTKKVPGPIHGVTSHKLAALAVALTFADGIRSN